MLEIKNPLEINIGEGRVFINPILTPFPDELAESPVSLTEQTRPYNKFQGRFTNRPYGKIRYSPKTFVLQLKWTVDHRPLTKDH
jgi:hypothetical protein